MSATQPIGVDSTPLSSEAAVRQQLDALAKGEIDHVTFLNNMKERFRFEPDDNWEVLSLLDQYYRRGKINLEVFRALKSGFAEYILGPQNSAPSQQGNTPTLHTVVMTPSAAVPAAPASSVAAHSRPSAAPTGAGAQAAAAAATHPIFAGPAPSPAPAAPPSAPAAPPAARAPVVNASAQQAFNNGTHTVVPPPADTTPSAGAAAPSRDAQVGDLLRNRYRLDALIGRGASGLVFEANDPFRLNLPPVGKRVAIKVLRNPDPRGVFINQLRQEFHHLQLLSHPNIVRAFDFDRDGALAFFTMELLSGEHLGRTLQSRGTPLERPHALAIIRDVGAALAYAHSRGIAHGDLNPQNVFITTRGEVRVLGFGASNKISDNSGTPEFEQASARSDSYRYASCEVLQGGRPDASDDLYSLACLAYLLLTGKHPFADRTSIEARAEHRSPRRPARLGYRQWQTLRAGLRTDARKRPSDVQQWLAGMELGAAARQLPSANELIDAATSGPRRMRWAIAALILVALLGGGYWLYTNQDMFGSPQVRTVQEAEPAGPPPSPSPSPSPPAAQVPAAAPSVAVPRPSAKVAPAPTPPAPATAVVRAPASAQAAPTRKAEGNTTVASAAAPAAHPGPQAPGASKVEMAVDTMDASPTDSVVHVIVRRKGNLHGQTSFTWWTESGTAKPGVDFVAVLPHVQQMQDGEASIVLSVPVLPSVRAQEKGFYVGIEEADGGAQIGARSLTQITLPPTN